MQNLEKSTHWAPVYGLVASIAVGFLMGLVRQFSVEAVNISEGISALLIFVAWLVIEGILTLFVPYQNSKLWKLANLCVLFVTYWLVVENFGIGGWGAA